MNKRGQLLLLAAIILEIAVLVSLATLRKYPSPRVIITRDYLQAAELVQLARLWIKSGFCQKCINTTLSKLREANQSFDLKICFSTYTLSHLNTSVSENYTVVFWGRSGRYVEVEVYWNWSYQGYYFKRIGGEEVKYLNYTVYYRHIYRGPWGTIVIYDLRLSDPLKQADIKYLENGFWIVGFPANYTEYRLVDRFTIPVTIGGES